MRCPTCGFSIDQANLTQCPHCGNVLPSPAGQMEHASQGAQGPMPPEYQPYPSYAPCPPPVNYPGTYGASAPPSGYGPYYGQAAPPSYPMTPGYPQPRYPQPLLAPLPVRKRRTGLIVGIVAAVVVVLAACTGVTAFALNAAGRTTTPAAVGTATLASGTSSPGTSTTPSGTIIYQNTFTSYPADWSEDQHCFSGATEDGYHVNSGYICFAPIGEQGDVDITVTVKQVRGTTLEPYGISFRRASAGNGYEFDIDSNGKWVLFKDVNRSGTRLVDYTANSAIKGGLNTSNTLEVRAKGSHFDFFVNGTSVGSYDDATFSSGRVGLAAAENIESVFTNLLITRPS